MDADLIKQCADHTLKPAIVEKFLEKAGSIDPLAITIRSGDKVIAIPKPKTSEEAMNLITKYSGEAAVRVGLTQYPSGYGLIDKSLIGREILAPCDNMRLGTMLFAKVYRIITKWYGSQVPEAFDDAITAYSSGYFEGKYVFDQPDPGQDMVAEPKANERRQVVTPSDYKTSAETLSKPPVDSDLDPRKAGIRINLSGVNQPLSK